MEYKEKLYYGLILYLGELPLEKTESYWENSLGKFDEKKLLNILDSLFDEEDKEIFKETFARPLDEKEVAKWTDVVEYVIELNDLPGPPAGATYDVYDSVRLSEDSEEYKEYKKPFKVLEAKLEKEVK